jgi:alkaline phosphatase
MRNSTVRVIKTFLSLAILAIAGFLIGGCAGPIGSLPREPDNLILFIGDGMGFEQLRAASLYETGQDVGLFIHGRSISTEVTTHSASSSITDSAAGATAIATGHKVQNGAVSVMLPGDGRDIKTILEMMQDDGKAVGLVTTTQLTHATPAAFGAHGDTRVDYEGIARDFLNQTRPDVLFGGGGFGLSIEAAVSAGYGVATTRTGLENLVNDGQTRVAALIGEGHLPYVYDGRDADQPTLLDMTRNAIDILSQDPDGYFLMVEAGRIDHAAHSNDLARMIPEVLELDSVVQAIVEDPQVMTSTLVVVTADHETGGLSVVQANGPGILPEVTWSTDYHTGVNVPLFAQGMSARWFETVSDNTEIFEAIATVFSL